MTQKEIAARLNLSRPTVSLALAGSEKINPDTRKRVLAMARELNYKPNLASRALSMKRSQSIGVLIPNTGPFYGELAEEIFKRMQMRNYLALFSFNVNHEHYLDALDQMVARSVDGIIAYQYPACESKLWELQNNGVPVLLYGESHIKALDRIGVDLRLCGYLAARHLLDMGRKRIACLCLLSDPMLGGYNAALRESGREPESGLVLNAEGEASGYEQMRSILRLAPALRPDAVVCHNDLTAMGAMLAATEAGVDIPREMAFTGRDDLSFCRYMNPPLTSARIDRAELAELLCTHIIAKVTGKNSQNIVEINMMPQLVIRKSSVACAISRLRS